MSNIDMTTIEQRMLNVATAINALIDEVNKTHSVKEKHFEIVETLDKAQHMMEDLFKRPPDEAA